MKIPLDRLLMRAKDAIIIGTAVWALVKLIYVKPMQIQEQVTRQERILIQQQKTMDKEQATMEKIAESIATSNRQLDRLNVRFEQFQHGFYSKKPGAWTYEDDRWKWSK